MISLVETNKKNINVNSLEYNDSNGCSVYAISNSFDITYDEAYDFCKVMYNRELKRGVKTYLFCGRNNMISNHRISYFGKRMRVIENTHYSSGKKRKMSVQTFIKNHPKGTFILGVRGHTFVVKDSVVYGIYNDSKKLRTHVSECWEVYDSENNGNDSLKRKKLMNDPNGGFMVYKKGDYIFLDRHITKRGNKWISERSILFQEHGCSYQRGIKIVASNLNDMEKKIREMYLIK